MRKDDIKFFCALRNEFTETKMTIVNKLIIIGKLPESIKMMFVSIQP